LYEQLESLKGNDVKLEQSDISPGAEEEEEVNSPAIGEVFSRHENSIENTAAGEIVKELRKLRRQNFVTQCLLSAMIVLTVAWQVSQVSIILQVKDGLSHPFKSFGSMLNGMLKRSGTKGQDSENQQSEVVPVKVPPFKIPELPHIDLGSNIE
jgi:hypothetical protein